MGFRENLRRELTYKGMLVKELAHLSGVHKRTLDTYLREKASAPPVEAAAAIARALGVSVEYLVTGEEPALPRDIQHIARNLLGLGEKDRRLVAAIVRILLERKEEPD